MFDFAAATGNPAVIVMKCDLGDLDSVTEFCDKFNTQESALHVLVNNAGKSQYRIPPFKGACAIYLIFGPKGPTITIFFPSSDMQISFGNSGI